MSTETSTQTTVTQEQIDAVIATITSRLGGVFATPSDIEPILQEMVNGDNALAPIANTLWGIAERMHQQQGVALTTVAMQTAMIEELTKQRDDSYQEAFDEGVLAGEECAFEDIYVMGMGDFGGAISMNQVAGLSEIQISTFVDVVYEERLDDKAKQLLHDLIVYVWEKSEADMGNVEF